MLLSNFFARDACVVAKELLGKVIYRKLDNIWLKARIIETEAYYLSDKSSHSSKGYTEKRKAMFMSPGTIYMYYSRGKDSMNISVGDEGDAVLIKSAYPVYNNIDDKIITKMRERYDIPNRDINKLCSGQTLLCQAMGITVKEWDQKDFSKNLFYIKDDGYKLSKIINTPRLGIPIGRDEHLLYRFIDYDFIKYCTKPVSNKIIDQISNNYTKYKDIKILNN